MYIHWSPDFLLLDESKTYCLFHQKYDFFRFSDFDVKPDLVWPYLSPVTSSAISDDTSLLAVGFENGNIIIWDRYLGIIYTIHTF